MKPTNQKIIDITSVSSVTLDISSNVENYVLTGTKVVSAPFTVVASGTPARNLEVWIFCRATLTTTGTPTFDILGTDVGLSLLASPFLAICKYLNGAWYVTVHNFPVKGSTTIEINVDDELIIKDDSIGDAHIKSDAEIVWTKLADGTAGQIMATDAVSKKPVTLDTGTYPTPAELIHVKGVTSAIQPQLTDRYTKADADAITNALGVLIADTYTKAQADVITDALGVLVADCYTKAQADVITDALGVLIADTYTKSEVDTAIAATTPAKVSSAIITGNTVLLSTTLKTDYECDATAGGFTITLPLANTVNSGTMVKFWLLGVANNVIIQRAGADNITDLNRSSVTSKTMTALGNWIFAVSDGSANWKIYSDKLT
ncbi:MAG: hypothetical protein WC998_09075 [Candidatus Paceibacterota bacterium]|jgi:hypothetical protein